MSYMQDLERELHQRLEAFASGDLSAHDFIAFVKKTVLESYRNGQAAGPRQPKQGGAETPAASVARDWRNEKRSAVSAPRKPINYKR
jgi:hypothetical protein